MGARRALQAWPPTDQAGPAQITRPCSLKGGIEKWLPSAVYFCEKLFHSFLFSTVVHAFKSVGRSQLHRVCLSLQPTRMPRATPDPAGRYAALECTVLLQERGVVG